MRLLDKETPQERAARRKGGLKTAFISGVILLIAVLAFPHTIGIEGNLGGYLFVGALIIGLGAFQGLVIGIGDAVLPPISRAFAFLIGLVCISIIAFYAFFPDGFGEAK